MRVSRTIVAVSAVTVALLATVAAVAVLRETRSAATGGLGERAGSGAGGTAAGSGAGVHPDTFYDRDLFFRGVTPTERDGLLASIDGTKSDGTGEVAAPLGRIKGAVVPHHYVGSRYIADMFARIAPQHPKTVLLIGPNHYERGDYAALTSEYAWRTEFGTVQPNRAVLAALVKSGAAHVDEDAVSGDHSVGGLMPFVKRFLPEATVVPVIIKRRPTQDELDALVAALADAAADPDTVVIASVDFSHYLTAAQADANDVETLDAMRHADVRRLLGFDNGHMDSPPSIVTLFATMQRLGLADFTLIAHENSGRILHDELGSTTSYFTLLFAEKAR